MMSVPPGAGYKAPTGRALKVPTGAGYKPPTGRVPSFKQLAAKKAKGSPMTRKRPPKAPPRPR